MTDSGTGTFQMSKTGNKKTGSEVGSGLLRERIRYLWEETDFAVSLFEKMTGYAVIAADFDGNIIAYNEGAREIYGYTPEEVVGIKSLDAFFPEEFIKDGRLREITKRLVEEGSFSFEGEKVRKGGGGSPPGCSSR